MKFEKYFDHTILKADATKDEIRAICEEALRYSFASVCVNSCHTAFVKNELKGSDVATCVVVGFPLGAMDIESKAFETKMAVKNGADEIDMVINVGALKDGDYDYVKADILAVRNECNGKILKVIIETCMLTNEEKVKACELAVEAGADFVKTSTGFGSAGATITDVSLMKTVAGSRAKVKAAGGIRDYNTAMAMIEAGADRLGTSATIKIVNDNK
ncbi:MAG: deoxyribose-phosphate aldolase [Lachnospira sp.]